VQERLFVGSLIWQLSPFHYFVLDLLFGQDGCELFHLKDLADFDFVVAGAVAGTTLDPLDGLPMLVRSSVLGRMPASESLLALTTTMQRIVVSPFYVQSELGFGA
jgi:hypothetical protein